MHALIPLNNQYQQLYGPNMNLMSEDLSNLPSVPMQTSDDSESQLLLHQLSLEELSMSPVQIYVKWQVD